MTRISVLLLLAPLSLSTACATAHGKPPATTQHEPGRATTHHSFADVERWSAIFDDPARDEWQKPEAVVAALDIKHGHTVADLGAGTGYFVPYLARAVGAEGTVYAVDVEPGMVGHLRKRAEESGHDQVIPVLASLDRPRLPTGRVELVLIVDTFHHLDHRADYLTKLAATLTPLGRVAIIDWRKQPLPEGPPPEHKLARSQVVDEMAGAGFVLIESPDILPFQYFLIFRKSDGTTSGARAAGTGRRGD